MASPSAPPRPAAIPSIPYTDDVIVVATLSRNPGALTVACAGMRVGTAAKQVSEQLRSSRCAVDGRERRGMEDGEDNLWVIMQAGTLRLDDSNGESASRACSGVTVTRPFPGAGVAPRIR